MPQASHREPTAGGRPASAWRRSPGLPFALAATLLLLLAHAWLYRFQCDDAFITFRYARNLSEGHGLVFNPGLERVEGYTNFLWTLMLAACARLGAAPDRAANPLTLVATVALWGLLVWFSGRRGRRHPWMVMVPVLLMAATRSVAVWSTSGLETRWFELLLVAGLLRLAVETESLRQGRAPLPVAGVLMALATLTRPDGLLLSVFALGAALALVARRHPRRAWWVGTLGLYGTLVGGHFLFRRLYYHAWLPNTYYAKVDGRTWWDAGTTYLTAFALEYAAILWVPLLIAAVVRHRRAGTLHVPILLAAAVVPHAIYVASIGGDHFEYRPLDLYFPIAFLLIGDGLEVIHERWGTWATGASLALVLAGLWSLPWKSHVQFPDRYMDGFPGLYRLEAARYLDPARDPLYRLPGLHAMAEAHRRALRTLTEHLIAVRQEEHRLFLATVVAQAHRLTRLTHQGLLPPDIYVATDCVGVIPYRTRWRTLDRRGLTDSTVAHSPFLETQERMMAHGKAASFEYARGRGVELWAVDPVHLVVPITWELVLAANQQADPRNPVYAAALDDGNAIVCHLPQGLEAARRRMPRLNFVDLRDPTFVRGYVADAIRALRDTVRLRPDDLDHRRRLDYFLVIEGRLDSLANRARN